MSRSATDRLKGLISEAELKRQNLWDQQAAREARLPANAFPRPAQGQRPSMDRAEKVCAAPGISMTIATPQPHHSRAIPRHARTHVNRTQRCPVAATRTVDCRRLPWL